MEVTGTSLLVVATIACGMTWVVDLLFLKRRRADPDAPRGLVTELAINLFPVLAVVTVFKGFLVDVYRIPSTDMRPNLEINDFVVVTKFDYGFVVPGQEVAVLSRGKAPAFGDVVVLSRNAAKKNGAEHVGVLRVVGIPGDEVAVYGNGVVHLNGVPIPDPSLDDGESVDNGPKSGDGPARLVKVGAGEYFVLADNRKTGKDSRAWGPVSNKDIVGKAVLVAMHCSGLACSQGFDRSRVGLEIR